MDDRFKNLVQTAVNPTDQIQHVGELATMNRALNQKVQELAKKVIELEDLCEKQRKQLSG